ncbi:hypothetical protein DYB32_002948 [Aphanomyces invadans]|uniref:Uncharacterized protein n=1 Tax=Aphanomyces invadans TaxID=157072 RepID=A0A3R6Z742_9STRA|nr:hypothetical protein DYB32_002948 [Aphanomyces invadans]
MCMLQLTWRSLIDVEPLDIDVGSLGRGFVSRDVLGSTSLDDAIARITRPGQASGHNIQGDKSYPIFHDDKSHVNGELSNWTLITALFDVKNGVLYLLHPRVNPSQARVAMVVDLFDVQRVTLLHTAPEQGTAQANMLAAKPRS